MIDALWGNEYIRTVMVALVFSWAATQVAKLGWRGIKGVSGIKPNPFYEAVAIRALAFASALLPVLNMWPDADAVWVGMALGLLSPMLYKLASHYAYHRWPMLEKWLSASPAFGRHND